MFYFMTLFNVELWKIFLLNHEICFLVEVISVETALYPKSSQYSKKRLKLSLMSTFRKLQ